MKELSADGKIALVATVTQEGRPHITLITSIQTKGETELLMGEFCRGESKNNIVLTKKCSFIAISLDRHYRIGKAEWTGAEEQGPDYEKMNLIPMFRYNTYFGIQKVHFLKLQSVTEKNPLPMGRIIVSSLKTKLFSSGVKSKTREQVLNPFSMKLIDTLDALSFLSYIGRDGYPEIVPVVQTHTAGSARVVFHPGAFGREIRAVPEGTGCAVFTMNMQMESVLVRGTYTGIKRSFGIPLGILDIDWVYNSIPPSHGVIYPMPEIITCQA